MKTRQTIFSAIGIPCPDMAFVQIVQTLEIAPKMWHLVPFLVPKSGLYAPGASRFMSLHYHQLERYAGLAGPES